jgi:putative aminopeptidase FrvX
MRSVGSHFKTLVAISTELIQDKDSSTKPTVKQPQKQEAPTRPQPAEQETTVEPIVVPDKQPRRVRHKKVQGRYLDVRYMCAAMVLWVGCFSWCPKIFKSSVVWVWSVKRDWREYERARNYSKGNVRVFGLW